MAREREAGQSTNRTRRGVAKPKERESRDQSDARSKLL